MHIKSLPVGQILASTPSHPGSFRTSAVLAMPLRAPQGCRRGGLAQGTVQGLARRPPSQQSWAA
jgi:hypothetical protein